MSDTTASGGAGEGGTPAPLTLAAADGAAATMYPKSGYPAAEPGAVGKGTQPPPSSARTAPRRRSRSRLLLTSRPRALQRSMPEQKTAEDKAAADAAAVPRFERFVPAEARKAFAEIREALDKIPITTDEEYGKVFEAIIERDKALVPAIEQELSKRQTEHWFKAADTNRAETMKQFNQEDLAGARTVVSKLFDKDTIA